MTNDYPFTRHWKDRHGVERWWFRRRGVNLPLPGQPGDPDFEAAYEAAVAGQAKPAPRPKIMPAGRTLNAVWNHIERSADFRTMAKTSQHNQRREARRLLETPLPSAQGTDLIGDVAIDMLKRSHVKAILAMNADRPHAAAHKLRALRKITKAALDLEWIEYDPCHKVKWRPKVKGIRAWTIDERAAYEARWPIGTPARLAYALALWTGSRRSDVHRITWADIENGEIHIIQKKTGRELYLPVLPELEAVLAGHARKDGPILLNAYGKPYTAAGLGIRMRQWKRAAGLDGCSLHGLRKCMGASLAEAGATAKEIMDVLGHKTLSESENYIRSAQQRILAKSGMGRLTGQKLTVVKGGKA
jgi:integrase